MTNTGGSNSENKIPEDANLGAEGPCDYFDLRKKEKARIKTAIEVAVSAHREALKVLGAAEESGEGAEEAEVVAEETLRVLREVLGLSDKEELQAGDTDPTAVPVEEPFAVSDPAAETVVDEPAPTHDFDEDEDEPVAAVG
ncbi:hypothetical protein HOG48_06395 [Candidatus Peregrinibacteria bacterium]|jgi:hypothetical protein|nr:hypothetical protein [Candidatus Peregrinibacteria bacterium]